MTKGKDFSPRQGIIIFLGADVVTFGCALGNGIGQSTGDGKNGFHCGFLPGASLFF
jgi:hypothetical protein